MLFAHGAMFGGHALYLKDGKLKYVYNYLGEKEQVVVSDKPIPTGKHVLGVEFTKDDADPRRPRSAPSTLYIDDHAGRRALEASRPSSASSPSAARA